MFSTSFLVVLLSCLLNGSWARYISLALNISLDELEGNRSELSADMLKTCMKETDLLMSDLNHFRLSELSNDPDIMDGIIDQDNQDNAGDKPNNIVDYDGSSPIIYSERNDESLQCFAYCLYEKLGLTKDGVLIEHDIYRRLFNIMEYEKTEVKECQNLQSSNKCEAAYKVYLCHNKIKTIEAERRIREILGYGNGENDDMGFNYDGGNEGNTADAPLEDSADNNPLDGELDDGDPKRNEI